MGISKLEVSLAADPGKVHEYPDIIPKHVSIEAVGNNFLVLQVSIIGSIVTIGAPCTVTVSWCKSEPHTLVAVRSIVYNPALVKL